MPGPRHPWPSRVISLITAVLALLLAWRALELTVTSSILLVTTVATGAAVAAAQVWARNSFESHVAVSLVVGTLLLGTLLSLTLGLPGDRRSTLGPVQGLFLVLPIATFVLQWLTLRQHQRRSTDTRTPYAR